MFSKSRHGSKICFWKKKLLRKNRISKLLQESRTSTLFYKLLYKHFCCAAVFFLIWYKLTIFGSSFCFNKCRDFVALFCFYLFVQLLDLLFFDFREQFLSKTDHNLPKRVFWELLFPYLNRGFKKTQVFFCQND